MATNDVVLEELIDEPRFSGRNAPPTGQRTPMPQQRSSGVPTQSQKQRGGVSSLDSTGIFDDEAVVAVGSKILTVIGVLLLGISSYLTYGAFAGSLLVWSPIALAFGIAWQAAFSSQQWRLLILARKYAERGDKRRAIRFAMLYLLCLSASVIPSVVALHIAAYDRVLEVLFAEPVAAGAAILIAAVLIDTLPEVILIRRKGR